MENTTFILVLSGLLAGSVNFFVNYLELPMPKAALAEDGDQWPKLKTIWIAMVGYAVVGVAGSMLTPLIDAILGGLKGLEIADGVPKSSQYAYILFGYGLVFGYSTTRLLLSILDSLLKRVSKIETNFKNIAEAKKNLTVESNKKALTANELSGRQWVSRYPGSNSISALASPFKENVQNFYEALKDATASVAINATLRPKERAYLMSTSYKIANEIITPEDAPTLDGVNIEWVHSNLQDSIAAAKEMVSGYGIIYQPAYPTKHSEGTAIDMDITWSGTLTIKQAEGTLKNIESTPRSNTNSEMQEVAITYGVFKLESDKPHWSDDGH